MKIHHEGYPTLILVFIILLIINLLVSFFSDGFNLLYVLTILVSLVLFLFFLQFFRLPLRTSDSSSAEIICPADGEVVVIEEAIEDEYFKDKRIQVSVFMSPFNVHANWYPVSGKVKYIKYHKGKYLVAWHPKSSTQNERSTIVLEAENGNEILVRQIAGAVARRIVTYSKLGSTIRKNQELGYIKFGSRVDVFLPLQTKIKVKLNDKVTGNKTILGEFC